MNWIIELANVVGALGTLIVACLVYTLGRQQAHRTNAIADRQHNLDRQSFRLNLLDRRLEVLSDVREVWSDFQQNARPKPDLITKLISALQKSRLIYENDVVNDLDGVADQLLSLQRNYHRQNDAKEYYTDKNMLNKLLEDQFVIEDKLTPILDPLIKKMIAATRVQEPTL